MLWPTYTRGDSLLADLDETPPSKDAIKKLKSFIEDLLPDQVEFNDVSRETLDRCCHLASLIGFAIHKDLRRWCWSYDYVGVMEGPFPLQRIPEHIGSVQEHAKSIMLRDFSNPKENIVNDNIIIYPALLTEGDESGRRYTSPTVVLQAVVIPS